MTVSYHLELASLSPLVILRVLFRWKGSVWNIFENLAHYFDTRLEYIPITFILGFFVDTILSRWSDIFINMGYIESYVLFIANYIHGKDENTKQLRRTLARYLCLTQIFVFRDISAQVKKRFPTTDSMINAGILLKEEKEKLDTIKLQYNKYWVPIRWIHSIALKARKEEIITSNLLYWKLCAEVDKFRYNLQLLYNYDWVPIPLVYSQVVFLAVYVYFFVCLISRQFIVSKNNIVNDLDLIVPMVTMIEFVFFTGWLKVAQALLNPFGDDDDDFECNYLIDKNLATSFCIVDNYDRVPEIRPDLFWRSHKGFSASTDTTLIRSTANFKLKLTMEQIEMVNYRSQSVSFNSRHRLSQISLYGYNQGEERIMKHNQISSEYDDLQTAGLEKTMNVMASNPNLFEGPINRTPLQLVQYSTSQTNYFVPSDLTMDSDKNNKAKIARL
ncbi:Bestrophin RFP-TM chloride channel family protein [Acanthocheilonema viteae]